MTTHVVILGAGFGGLELSARLSEALADEVRITLIDRNDSFLFGFSKFDVMLGRKTADQLRSYYADITTPGVEFRQEQVTAIDPSGRRVTTDANTYEADILVVALGADYAPDATPGFADGGYDFYSVPGAERLRDLLPSITAGRIVIGILGTPFKCPPAPFEGAFLLHEYFTDRGVRDAVDIHMVSPMGSPIPVSAETSQALVAALDERGITYTFGQRVTAIDPAAKVAKVTDGADVPYDVFIGVPVHRVPTVVEESGLTAGGNEGWVKVNPANLATPHPGVYALGDVADAPVPRAGVFAENAARAVADDIVAGLRGGTFEVPFEGRGTCYIEMGEGLVGKVEADFLSGPEPRVPFSGPSAAFTREKEEFGASRRRRWFGS